jgi:mannosyl-oligosaccharide glucosidase
VNHGLEKLSAAYNDRFETMYPLPTEFDGQPDHDALKQFSKEITANLLGGVGYFYGTSLVDKGFAYEWDQEDEPMDASEDEDQTSATKESGARLTEPRALLTATPSRSFFPRGFYWCVPSFGYIV